MSLRMMFVPMIRLVVSWGVLFRYVVHRGVQLFSEGFLTLERLRAVMIGSILGRNIKMSERDITEPVREGLILIRGYSPVCDGVDARF